MRSEQLGPNVKKLIFERLATDVVGSGADALPRAVEALQAPGLLSAKFKEAAAIVAEGIARIKACPDNPYGTDDEVIAAEILRRIEERKRQ